MLRRARSHRKRKVETDREEARHQAEVVKLQSKVARLENALAHMIASAGEPIDLRVEQPKEARTPTEPTTGFAAAWSGADSTSLPPVGEDFFATGHVDQRARNWLLTTK